MQAPAYAEAFQNGFGATRRFLISRGAALEEAEEIAQAAWARGWEYREQLRDPGLVSYWVNSIARNLYRARFRSAVPVPLDLYATAGPQVRAGECSTRARTATAHCWNGLSRATPRRSFRGRQVLVLRESAYACCARAKLSGKN